MLTDRINNFMEQLKDKVVKMLSNPVIGVGAPIGSYSINSLLELTEWAKIATIWIGFLVGLASFVYWIVKIKRELSK